MSKIFNNKKTTIKNKSKYIVLAALMIVSIFSVSYAVFTVQLKGDKKYSLTVGTLDFKIDNEQNSIRLMNAYPMSDAEGQALRPYTFALTNTGTLKEYYKISLITDTEQQATCTGCTFLSPSKLRYSLTVDGGTPIIGTVTDQTVLELGELAKGQSKNYELRLWLSSEATVEEENKYYFGKIKVDASQEKTLTFADIMKEKLQETPEGMFNYTSEGVDPTGGDSVEATNGIYAMEDNDGLSYYFRGNVNNYVKFGRYNSNYYVYRGSDGGDYIDLEDCQANNTDCGKVLKYQSYDDKPIYWRIVRVNGDGTIRMVYAGTSVDAEGQELGIGLSSYNKEYNDPKYVGYTYNKLTQEVDSNAKSKIDAWYEDILEGTAKERYVVTGKFCSDSSGYEYDANATQMIGSEAYTFEGFRRNFANMFGTGNANPTFKCSNETDSNFGGSYNLKAGLMTLDEVVAAGSQATENTSSYLYDTNGFFTMSPAVFQGGLAIIGGSGDGGSFFNRVNLNAVSLRPVINLRADVVFKEGTDGSKEYPYEIQEESGTEK